MISFSKTLYSALCLLRLEEKRKIDSDLEEQKGCNTVVMARGGSGRTTQGNWSSFIRPECPYMQTPTMMHDLAKGIAKISQV
jgi:hypothetical protein